MPYKLVALAGSATLLKDIPQLLLKKYTVIQSHRKMLRKYPLKNSSVFEKCTTNGFARDINQIIWSSHFREFAM